MLNFAPSIEKFVGREQGAEFIVNSVTDYNKRIISEQFGNIAAIANCQLSIGIFDCGILLNDIFELQNYQWNAIDKNDTVGYASIFAIDFKLIDELIYIRGFLLLFSKVIVNQIDIYVGSLRLSENPSIIIRIASTFSA